MLELQPPFAMYTAGNTAHNFHGFTTQPTAYTRPGDVYGASGSPRRDPAGDFSSYVPQTRSYESQQYAPSQPVAPSYAQYGQHQYRRSSDAAAYGSVEHQPRTRTPPPAREPTVNAASAQVALNPYNLGATSYKQAATRYGYQSTVSRIGSNPATATQFTGQPAAQQAPTGGRARAGGQRVRGQSFKNEWQGGAGPRGRKRAPSMVGATGQYMLPAQKPEDHGKCVVVLDLDETLVYARDGPLYARPGLQDFLRLLGQRTEGVAWTAGVRAYAQAVVRNIDREGHLKHCVYRHAKWFSGGAGYTKDLKLLGRDLDKTIIVENTPDCIRYYPNNSILLADYERDETNEDAADSTLPILTRLISELINSGQTVPQFLASTNLLRKKQVETDVGDYITVNFLDVNDTGLHAGHQRVNRDLPGY